MAKRTCKARTKAGKRCKAPPLSDSEFCISHSPKAVQSEAGFGGVLNARKGGRATRVPRLTELLAEKVEERAEEIVAKLLAGLSAERALVVGTGPKARLETAPDPEMVLKTIREVFDRTDGRPTQRQEIKGEFTHLTEDEYRKEVTRLRQLVNPDRRNGHHNGRRRSRSSV